MKYSEIYSKLNENPDTLYVTQFQGIPIVRINSIATFSVDYEGDIENEFCIEAIDWKGDTHTFRPNNILYPLPGNVEINFKKPFTK